MTKMTCQHSWKDFGSDDHEELMCEKCYAHFVPKKEPQTTLLPCPFCGNPPDDPVDATRILGTWRIGHRCEIIGYISIETSHKEKGIILWNTRQ